jgi:Predicted Zn-dependent protease (DUF2268)
VRSMKRIIAGALIAVLPWSLQPGLAWSAPQSHAVAGPVIHTEDVARFYRVYDAAGGHPSREQLQGDYLDRGSEGLQHFAKARNVTAERIADNLAKHPEMYLDARRCVDVLPRVRLRLAAAIRKLAALYPDAQLLPVTIVVGRGKPVGIASSRSGVQIGLEALCATTWMNPNLEDRFVHTIAHEYGHVQQLSALDDDEHPTVLEASLIEGGAELTAELISGEVGYSQLAAATRGREQELETAFAADEDSTDLSRWLYNSTLEKPGDLGYWVGWRIVKSYYQHATDKRRAFREILEMTDPHVILEKSGWYPGIELK